MDGIKEPELHTCPSCNAIVLKTIIAVPCGVHKWTVYASCQCGYEWRLRDGTHFGSDIVEIPCSVTRCYDEVTCLSTGAVSVRNPAGADDYTAQSVNIVTPTGTVCLVGNDVDVLYHALHNYFQTKSRVDNGA